MSNTAKEIAGLRPDRRRLFELLLKQAAAPTPLIARRRADAIVPLSLSQQRFWVMHQLKANNFVFNSPTAVRLQGYLNVEALERTLSEIVRRHESLRTTFSIVEGQPAQIIHAPSPMELPPTLLDRLPEAERHTTAKRLATEHATRPFDLQRGPLVRARLLRLGELDHIALFTMHHIVADAWSVGVLIREVAALYDAFANRRPSPLSEPLIQFADFAVWERCHICNETLERQLDYWKRQLGGKLKRLELPTDRPRPGALSDRGATQQFRLSETLTLLYRDVCMRENVTLYMLLLAVYGALLYRYTGETDILIGSPTANRNRTETESLIGCFVNTLVMRLDLSGNPTFRELLRRVRGTALDAFAHQDAPFDKVVEALRREHMRGHENLYRVWFVLQNVPMESLNLTDLTLSNFSSEREMTPNDLTLSVTEVDAELVFTLDYRIELFDADTVAEILERFQSLLQSVSLKPETRLLDAPLDLNETGSPLTTPPLKVGARYKEETFIL